MKLLLVAFAALGGAILPLQALINARLGSVMNGPVWAATISFAASAGRSPADAMASATTTPAATPPR